MATPTTGTIPALPQYGTGALVLATTVSIEIVDTANATAAASYRMLQSDFVGKAPGVMLPGTPIGSDVISFLQNATNLPRSCAIASLGLTFGNLPTGGATGTLLSKNSGTNYDAGWSAVSSFLSASTSITLSGSTTVAVSVSNFGIGSSQIATNAVGDVQLRQGAALSVIGNATGSLANVADIAASGGGLFLQSNTAGTGLIWGSAPGASVSFGTPYTTAGVIYASGATALAGTNFGTTGMFLMGNGSVTAPGFTLINLGNSTSVTGTTRIVNGGTGTNVLSPFGVMLGGTTTVAVVAATTAGMFLQASGSVTAPGYALVNLAAATNVTGITGFGNGGTGTSTLATPFGVVLGGTTALGVTAAGTSGFVLAGTGTTTAPTFQNITTLAVTLITAGGGLSVSQGATGGSITGTGTLYAQHTPAYKVATYTVAATDLGATIIFTTGSLATCVLGTTNATGLGSGFFVDLYNAAATGIVIAPLGAAVITGIGATAIMPAGTGMRMVSDATNWVPQFAAGAYALHLSKTNQSFSGGIRLVSFNAGTTSGGTSITFDSGNGPIQHVRNAGTGTFTAPSSDGELDVLVMATTNASTITFSGFNASASAPTGDTVTWNATAIYLFSMRRVNGSSTYRVAAYQ